LHSLKGQHTIATVKSGIKSIMKSVAALKLKTMRTFFGLMAGSKMMIINNEKLDAKFKEALSPLLTKKCEA